MMRTAELRSAPASGGDLHKVEPKELTQIPARVVLESIDAHIGIEQQERLFA